MDDEYAEEVAAVIQTVIEEEHGYLSWLDTTVEEVDSGRMVMRVPFDEKLTNPTEPPSMHGGIAATLVDTAGGMACHTLLDNPLESGVATVNLNVNYLQRAMGDLTATAEVVRAGSTIGVSDIVVESTTDDGDTEPVAVGQGAYRLFRS